MTKKINKSDDHFNTTDENQETVKRYAKKNVNQKVSNQNIILDSRRYSLYII